MNYERYYRSILDDIVKVLEEEDDLDDIRCEICENDEDPCESCTKEAEMKFQNEKLKEIRDLMEDY